MKIMVHRWFFFVAKDMGWNIMDFGKGQKGSALIWSLQLSCVLVRGTFWVLPLTQFDIHKSARAYLVPQSVKTHCFCSGPISVDAAENCTALGSTAVPPPPPRPAKNYTIVISRRIPLSESQAEKYRRPHLSATKDFVLSLSEAWNLILLLLMAGGGGKYIHRSI